MNEGGGRSRADDVWDLGDRSYCCLDSLLAVGLSTRPWSEGSGLTDSSVPRVDVSAAASMKDLLSLVRDDWLLITLGFVFLLLAAVSQVRGGGDQPHSVPPVFRLVE